MNLDFICLMKCIIDYRNTEIFMYIDDTIAAIATPPGIGGVGIIRVSGKDSFPIVNSLFKSAGTVPLMDRQK